MTNLLKYLQEIEVHLIKTHSKIFNIICYDEETYEVEILEFNPMNIIENYKIKKVNKRGRIYEETISYKELKRQIKNYEEKSN